MSFNQHKVKDAYQGIEVLDQDINLEKISFLKYNQANQEADGRMVKR